MRTQPPSSDAELICADAVARRFGRRWALRGVSLRVRPGEVLAIRGSNGSGKSTLLRIVASAIRPTRGRCRVLGHDVVRDARHVRPLVGLLGHAPGIYEDLTVAENLRFAARMMGCADDARAIDRAIDAVGLAAAAGERARHLSSGMQRRVALARLIMHAPTLLLLDEPYNSFDLDGVERVNALVNATRESGGATLLVTHDVERLGGLADRIATMDDGLLVDDAAAGTIDEPSEDSVDDSVDDSVEDDGVIALPAMRVARGSAR